MTSYYKFRKLDINGLYANCQPIMPDYEIVKKELKGNDFLKLYGALALITENNKEYLTDYYRQSIGDALDSASIGDNELYLFHFEGYEINERYNLKTLYLADNDNIIMSVYDNKKDRYLDFIA